MREIVNATIERGNVSFFQVREGGGEINRSEVNLRRGECSVDYADKFFNCRDTGKMGGLRSAINAHRKDNMFGVIHRVGIIEKKRAKMFKICSRKATSEEVRRSGREKIYVTVANDGHSTIKCR